MAGKDESTNLHAGHRQRLRNRFVRDGLLSFEDHTILELLLFYTIPKRDTNEIAHRLLNKFGSFSGVLDAPRKELVTVKGVGEKSAILLSLLPALSARYLLSKNEEACEEEAAPLCPAKNFSPDFPEKAELLPNFLKSYYSSHTKEELLLFCLGSRNRVISMDKTDLDATCSTVAKARWILKNAFREHSSAVILAHNHPKGPDGASEQDIDSTLSLVGTLSALGITLKEHYVISKDSHWAILDRLSAAPRTVEIVLPTE